MSKPGEADDIGPRKVNGAYRQQCGVPTQVMRLETDDLDCDVCGSPMTLEKTSRVHKGKKSWRVRRFTCACGYQTTIHATGHRDTNPS